MKELGKKKEIGITLIALVITIIILLILAGITISQLSGSGIFEKMKEARNKWQNAQNEEEMQIAKYSNEIDSYVGGGRNGLLGITNKLTTTNITSSSWTKMELNESIDNYKFLQLTNTSSYGTHTQIACSFIVSPNQFKNTYNSEDNAIELYVYTSAERTVYFYYNTTDSSIYGKTANSGFFPIIYGIK